ncbi:hypothetical protein DI487_15565 [Flavobacterium sediminis]|uniref:Uncharacterized protein n=2 Tax=Flavobacteriaceae TaxID=49546 RepID=A0A2U8QYJ3_9FLAO|nr:hypothetical protein DI487_15565 [Flavobacterium sediminis]
MSSHTVKEVANCSPEIIAQSLRLEDSVSFQTDETSGNKFSLTAKEKEQEKIEIAENEIEEEEILHVKKYLDYNNYFGLFCTKVLDPYCYSSDKSLSIGKSSFFYSSLESLYIVFRVFRL